MATLLPAQDNRKSTSGSISLTDLQVQLIPDYLPVALHARGADRVQGLWHRMIPPGGFTVRLTSQSAEMRILRLTVASEASGWNAGWPCWGYAIRHASELLGGAAVDAQDKLADDRTAVTLLLLPGETRDAILEIRALLGSDTAPGEYPFVIQVLDMTYGEGEATHLEAQVELCHPPSHLLDMMPSIYREAMQSMGGQSGHNMPFFVRFLRGFEDIQEPLERMISMLHLCFGPYSAPADFVPWLSTWVGLALNANWPEMRRRRLIAEAVELYRWRGTRKGLMRYLEIYSGVNADIADQPFSGWRLGPESLLGRNTVLGDVPDHAFVVTLAVPDPAAINEQIVREIIESEKPAHTGYSLRIVRRISVEEERAIL